MLPYCARLDTTRSEGRPSRCGKQGRLGRGARMSVYVIKREAKGLQSARHASKLCSCWPRKRLRCEACPCCQAWTGRSKTLSTPTPMGSIPCL